MSGRKTAGQKPASVECPTPTVPDLLRDFMRSAGSRMPIYDNPFPGCKVLNLTLAGTPFSWSGLTYVPMTTISQGVADNQRTGDVVRVIGVDYRVRIHIGSAAAPAADADYQIQLVYSPLPVIAASSVFQELGTTAAGTSCDDWDYRAVVKRYHRVFSRVDSLHPLNVHQASVRCNELTNYDSGGTALTFGGWVLALVSSEDPAAATELPAARGAMQIYYQDV